MNKIVKFVLGTIGAVVIGAIGSGVWEYIFQPALRSGSNILLEVATLGIESFKNDLYRDVAKGYREQASYSLLLSFTSLLISGYIVGCLIMFSKVKDMIKAEQETLADLNEMELEIEHGPTEEIDDKPEKADLLERIEDIRKSLQSSGSKKIKKYCYAMTLIVVVISVSKFVGIIKDGYINGAVTHYTQMVRIVSPYVEKDRLIEIESEFSQIQSSSDYEKIIDSLNFYIQEHQLHKPQFSVW